MRAHGLRATGLGVVMVAEGRSKGQVALGEWCHDLVDDAFELVGAHELAGDEVAVEHCQIRMLVVEDRVHETDGLRVFTLTRR